MTEEIREAKDKAAKAELRYLTALDALCYARDEARHAEMCMDIAYDRLNNLYEKNGENAHAE